MTDALTCEKCGADLRAGDGHRLGPRDHHPLDCAALAAANARIAEQQGELDSDREWATLANTAFLAERAAYATVAPLVVEIANLRAQLAAARAELMQRAKAVGG